MGQHCRLGRLYYCGLHSASRPYDPGKDSHESRGVEFIAEERRAHSKGHLRAQHILRGDADNDKGISVLLDLLSVLWSNGSNLWVTSPLVD